MSQSMIIFLDDHILAVIAVQASLIIRVRAIFPLRPHHGCAVPACISKTTTDAVQEARGTINSTSPMTLAFAPMRTRITHS